MSSKILVKGYQIGHQIDQVGLKTIYKALHLISGREVFITVIPARMKRTQNALLRRARLSKRLTIPGIVTAMNCGLLPEDKIYYSHNVVESQSIQTFLQSVPQKERMYLTLGLFIEVLEKVNYIHEAGTTHRDLSISQLRVDKLRGLLLEGFINARPKNEARNIASIVNLPYMAPEQLMGAPADRRSDIYSLGMILFELLTDRLPYESNYTKLEDHRRGVIPSPSQFNPNLSSDLESIILKAISQRGSRYPSLLHFQNDLEEIYRKRSISHKLRDFSSSLKNLLLSRK
jgi:serine/threonine protein kinase